MLIPSSALIGNDCVYVIERRSGFFEEELYLCLQPVSIDAFQDGMAVLNYGVLTQDYVVVGWDRPIADGQRVMQAYS